MAITKMNRFTLICFRKDKKSVLKNLQRFGNSELINLKTDTNEEDNPLNLLSKEEYSGDMSEVDKSLSTLKSAIRFLGQYESGKSGIKALRDGKQVLFYEELEKIASSFKWEEYCSDINAKEQRILTVESEISNLSNNIDMLTPWMKLDIPFNELSISSNVSSFIGTVSRNYCMDFKESIEKLELAELKIVSEDNQYAYVVLIAHNEQIEEVKEILKKVDYSEFKFPCAVKVEEEIVSLKGRIQELRNEKASIISSLKSESRLDDLRKCEEYYANLQIQIQANQNLAGSEKTVVISGWVPKESNDKLDYLVKLGTGDTYVLNFDEVGDNEDLEVPVKLKNNKFIKPFQSITEMYSVPNYKGIDPTPLLAPFYMLFFGMMVGDFAYGLMITIACIAALKIFKLDEGSKDFAKLFMWLGISTTAWGLVYGAGFGDKIQFDSLLNMNDDIMAIMGLSIGFGIFQILVALFIKAYTLIRVKQYFAAFADVGLWLVTFAGITMFALSVPFGKWIMIAGMVGIVLTNGRESNGAAGKLASGAYALYGITNYVGDLVSYTRLMALGVAGGSIATAMNLIIGQLPSNIVVTVIIVPLLFIAVHIFNLLLGALGAYVHACRLQYVEYFGKFYEGGGKSFEPLQLKNDYIDVK